MSEVGTIPQSAALKEARTDSLSELFSRVPDLSVEDRKKIIVALREKREQFQRDELLDKRSKAEKINKGPQKGTEASAELDL